MKQLLFSVVLAATVGTAPAWAQVKIGVIHASTGPMAVIGIPQKNTIKLLPTKIGNVEIEYISLDDGADATQTVKVFKKLTLEDNVDAIIGPSGSPNAMAVLPFAAESKTPMLAPVGTSAVVLPMDDKRRWVFKTTQNDSLIAEALIEHMVGAGIRTVGFIASSDPYGESWAKTFADLAKAAGIAVPVSERFQRNDVSVTAQSLRIAAANPQAVLIASAGAVNVLPQATLVDQGYKGRIYQTHGAATPEFLKLGGAKVEGTILAASLMLVLPEIPDANPSKKVASDYIDQYSKLYGAAPATFGANVYDAGLLLEKAIPIATKAAKPGTAEFRSALRDAIETTQELVGTQGVYNMSPVDHSGFDKRGRVLIEVKNGQWRLLSK